MANPVVTIEMENGGKIVAELYPEIAPETVNNFISLAKQGFYDGTDFPPGHPRLYDPGRLTPRAPAWAAPATASRASSCQNGVQNNLSHNRGVLSMARAMSSQLRRQPVLHYARRRKAPHLDGSMPPSARSPRAWTWLTPSPTVKTGL